jgi:hypothetical protein
MVPPLTGRVWQWVTGFNHSKAVIDTLNWIFYSLIFPLIPMTMGVLTRHLQTHPVPREHLFGGAELFLVSLVVLATTKNELDSEINAQESALLSTLSRLLLYFVIVSAVVVGMIYIDDRVVGVGFDKKKVANAAIQISILTSIICTVLHILIAAVKNSPLDDTQRG